MNYSPALLKLFDEILVNALDCHTRGTGVTRIDVTCGEHRTHAAVCHPIHLPLCMFSGSVGFAEWPCLCFLLLIAQLCR